MHAELKEIIDNAQNIVFFGGAGVSTGSGIPDFRGKDGLYTDADETRDNPETVLSGWYLRQFPELFFDFYRTNMLHPDARPNAAHRTLAQLEREGKLSAVITQNIDGLHQMAGSKNVIELHGSILRNFCTRCARQYPLSHIVDTDGVPKCEKCGAIVRPDVVLYGENLDGEAFSKAEEAIADADVLIVGGTSLTVHPAASLVTLFQGEHFVILNRTPTPYDGYADLVLREPIEDVLALN